MQCKYIFNLLCKEYPVLIKTKIILNRNSILYHIRVKSIFSSDFVEHLCFFLKTTNRIAYDCYIILGNMRKMKCFIYNIM